MSGTPKTPMLLWGFVLAAAAVATGFAALAPLASLAVAATLGLGVVLVRRFGALHGTFYLFVATLPVREPLGIDVAGTKTLYLGDLLLYGITAATLRRHGLARIWQDSTTLRLGAVLLALSVFGVYGSPNPFWELAAIQRVFGQIASLYVARALIRNGAEARTLLVAFVIGVVPAVLYGFRQSAIPIAAGNFPEWSEVPLAYDAAGRAVVRVFSTFDNPLHLSQALGMAVGMAIGLIGPIRGRLARLGLVAVAIGAAACNQFTYSVSGIIGTGAAALTALTVGRSRKWLWAFPLLFAASIVTAPEALFVRIANLGTGGSNSAAIRLITYQQGLRALADHPIRGIGWGGITELVEGKYVVARGEQIPTAPENYFLYRMVVFGVPGLLLYGALPILFLRNCRRPPPGRAGDRGRSWPRGAIFAAVVAYWVQAMLFSSGSQPNNYLLWLLLGLAESMRRAWDPAPNSVETAPAPVEAGPVPA